MRTKYILALLFIFLIIPSIVIAQETETKTVEVYGPLVS
jgi:hypothetical protein